MNIARIEAINAATLEALQRNPGKVDYWTNPYFGYYVVDIFECPSFVMFTNHDCMRAKDILYHRYFEPGSMKLWCRLAKLATGIIDIGAQVGVYSLAAAALRADIPIYAFEPHPFAFARLRVHIQVNQFGSIVEDHSAIAHQEGHTQFSWLKKPGQPISSGGHLGAPTQNQDAYEQTIVTLTPLDKTLAATNIGPQGLIKIDVEGAEGLVFRGMPKALARRPDIILESFDSKNCDAINAMTRPLGYRAYHIREKAKELVPQDGLIPQNTKGEDFNQFLTVRPHEEVAALMAA